MRSYKDFGKAILILFGGLALAGAVALILINVRKTKMFETELFSQPVTVTYFFMETCPHCVKMKPEWAKFVEAAKKEGITTQEASPATNAALVREKQVTGFPTVIVTVGDKDVPYPSDAEHPRTADGLMAFVKEQAA